MKPTFEKFGAMVDCSRNAVMTPDALKKFITILAKMGYNQLHLYMEDTYNVEGEERFGYLRGGYTSSELKDLDDFATELGVELVPNVQTLAHMSTFNRWRNDLFDIGDIMMVGNEDVYDLIDRMFKTLRSCFRTKNLHIGMDEAHLLGRGKYFDLHGEENRFNILLKHLNRVCEIAKKYDFIPMMWSDMFYRLANGGQYYAKNSSFDASIKKHIPENLSLVYWDYYNTDPRTYRAMIRGHHKLSDNVIFAGGAWRWSGFAPNNYYSIRTTKAALPVCKKEGITNAFITMWGDNGAECSSFAVLPSLCYAACLSQGITKMSTVKEKFKEWVGLSYDDFMLLDKPNRLIPVDRVINPAKYFLYADCFMSLFLNLEQDEYSKTYRSTARKLKNAAKRTGEFSYIFNTLSALCRVLEIKQNICSRTREACLKKDPELLKALLSDYKTMIRRTEEFHALFRTQWMTENKPHGFEVQDARIGGLIQRMKSCRDRLSDFADGKIDSIPELEEKIIPIYDTLSVRNNWASSITNHPI